MSGRFAWAGCGRWFRADHEQLRYEDSLLAQGALIQVQQGLGKHMATKTCESLEQK